MPLGTTLLIDVQKLVECPICCETFVDPLQLSCGHTFCRSCLDKLTESKSANNCDPVVRCPECRQDTRLPTTGLPINYRLRDMAALVTSTSTSASATHTYSKEEKCYLKCLICSDALKNGVFMSCCDCAIEDIRALQMCPACCLIYHNGHNIVERLEEVFLSASLIAGMESSLQKRPSQQLPSLTRLALSEGTIDSYRQGQRHGASMERTILNEEVNHELYRNVSERHEGALIEVERISTNLTFGARTSPESTRARMLPVVMERIKKCCDCCSCTIFTLIIAFLEYFACFMVLLIIVWSQS